MNQKEEPTAEGMGFPVDLVYLWVDGSDPEWRRRHDRACGIVHENTGEDCSGRYADNEELRFSLRSVEKYAPWIRTVFIVTDRQVPRWLDTAHPKIRIVDHSEILPPKAMPTFNSVVIEHHLHRIPRLADHFLYANDDMMFNRPVSPSDFFTPDGLPVARLNRRPFRKLTLWLEVAVEHKTLSNYNRTIANAARLVKEKYGKYIGHKTHHNIDAYRKSDMAATYETFREAIEPTLTNHIRSDSDIQRNLYTYAAMVEGKCKVEFVGRTTSFRFHIDNRSHYRKLLRCRPMLVCFNDSQFATDDDRIRVRRFLETLYPEPSGFEIV